MNGKVSKPLRTVSSFLGFIFYDLFDCSGGPRKGSGGPGAPPSLFRVKKKKKKKRIAVGREAGRASDKKPPPPPLLLAQGLDPPLDCNFTKVCESHQNVDTYLVCLLTSCMISNALIPGGVAIIHCAQIIARAFAFIRFTSCCCVILQDKKKKIYLVNLFYSS